METDLVVLKNEKLYVSTKIISKNCNVEHRAVLQLIKTHRKDIEDFGKLIEDIEKIPKGRPLNIFLLNEEQFTFLVTLMQNSKVTVQAKKNITKEFFRMRKALLQIEMNRQNEAWVETRQDGKKARKELTDAIKKLLEVHNSNNPESTYVKRPNLLYSNITKMIDKTLFDIQSATSNKRDYMTKKQLSSLDMLEIRLSEKIYEYIDNGKDAKQSYALLQEEIKPFVEWIGGKSLIIDFINFKQIESEEAKNVNLI